MAQVGECSLDSPVTPIPVLGGHADHQTQDLVSGARPAWASLLVGVIFPGDQPPMTIAGVTMVVSSLSMRQPNWLGPDCQASAPVIVKTAVHKNS